MREWSSFHYPFLMNTIKLNSGEILSAMKKKACDLSDVVIEEKEAKKFIASIIEEVRKWRDIYIWIW